MSSPQPPNSLLPILRRTCLALIFACLLLPSLTASAQSGASLSGRVTNSDGEPVSPVSVRLYRLDELSNEWNMENNVEVDADGFYTFNLQSEGKVRLQFFPSLNLGGYWPEFYPNQTSLDAAEDIVIALGDQLTGYDVTLPNAPKIVGTVVDGNHKGIPGIDVQLLGDEGQGIWISSQTDTDSDGKFTMRFPYDQEYRLFFNDKTDINFIEEYYNNKTTLLSSDPITLTAEEVLTLTVDLKPAPSISGTVKDSQGTPISGVLVTAHENSGDTWVYTDENGFYAFNSLKRSQYRLGFDKHNSIVSEYYQDQSSFFNAQIIDFSIDPDAYIANATVTRYGNITGTVTNINDEPLAGILVWLFYWEDDEWVTNGDVVKTDINGNYQINARYNTGNRLRFQTNYSGEQSARVVTEYYPNARTIEAGQSITVPVETTIPNIDVQLDIYGLVTGTVTNNVGVPLEGVFVHYYSDPDGTGNWLPGNYQVGATYTDAQGNYSLFVEPGESRIFFSHPSYESEFYDNQPTVEAATPFSVPYNSVVPNINAQLTNGTLISGMVTDNNGDVLEGIAVIAYDSEMDVVLTDFTDESGRYALALTSGTYRLSFNEYAAVNKQYDGEYYENATSLYDGAEIVLAPNNDLVINAELAILPTISGHIQDSSGEPVGTFAELRKRVIVDGEPVWECCTVVVESDPDNGGLYEFNNVEVGDYIVYFDGDYAPRGFQPEFYPNQYEEANAAILTVSARTILTDIDAVLQRHGSFVGTVVNEDNVALPGIDVWIYDEAAPGGDMSYHPYPITTDASGQFTLTMYASVPTLLEFTDPTRQYAGEFYNNHPNLDDAEPITVSVESTKTALVPLGETATITGHVTNASGVPIEGAIVRPFVYWPFDYPRWEPLHNTSVNATTDVNGNYQLDGLSPNARYQIVFYYQEMAYPYPYPENFQNAQEIVIPTPSVLPNINMMILLAGEALADFSAAPSNGSAPLIVSFTDESKGYVIGRNWDFGDGTTSGETNPSHTYTQTGTYSVTLTATGAVNTDDETKVGYITVGDTPITSIAIQQTNPGGNPDEQPTVGETLYFSATAAGSNVQFLWDFGDGALSAASTATGQYVQHSYAAPGNYTVTLTARNGVDEEVMTLPIAVQDDEDPPGEEPVSALTLNAPSNALVNSTVALSATAAGDNITYAWGFGDGGGGTGKEVSHTYTVAGTYTITLTASNTQGEVVATSEIIVTNHSLRLPHLER